MSKGRPKGVMRPGDYDKGSYRTEYLVVGTGAGGSVAGVALAEAGKDVILMEEGGYHTTESFTSNVGEMTARLYRNQGVSPFLGTPAIAFAEGCCVGGGTTINGGLIWRTPPWILDEWEAVHGLKGYGNRELARHFDKVERDLHVVIHTLEEDANLDSALLLKGAAELGWKTVMVPRAIKNCTNENLCPTGCTTGAKQSTLVAHIPRALKAGARLLYGCRAVKAVHSGGTAKKVLAQTMGGAGRLVEVEFDHLVLAGGAVQTPHLIRRSGMSRAAGRKLEFHINLKVGAIFKDRINAERGTILTTQVQEFEREGLLIMASTLKPHYLAMTLSHFGPGVIDNALRRYDHSAIYVAMYRPKSKAHVFSGLGGQPLVWYGLDKGDLPGIKLSLRRCAQVLFQAGAEELYMPVSGSGAVRSMAGLDRVLEGIRPSSLELISVHAMASCPMGASPENSVVDPDGRLRGMKNVLVCDASVLPTNIGESPQGTLMAFVHEIMERHLQG